MYNVKDLEYEQIVENAIISNDPGTPVSSTQHSRMNVLKIVKNLPSEETVIQKNKSV